MGEPEEEGEHEPRAEPFAVDLRVAQPARLRDAMLGGADHFTVDEKAADHITSGLPGGAATGKRILEANGAFRRRAVRHLAADRQVDQFLSVGIGVPRGRTTHEIAQSVLPHARVVYSITDPVVMAHAHELRSGPGGAVAYVHSGLQEPDELIAQAAATLDLARPMALLLTTLTFVPDRDDPWRATAALVARAAPGSYLVVAQLASDIDRDVLAPAAERHQELAAGRQMRPLAARSHAQVSRFFEGLELIDPGLVPVDRWRPDGGDGSDGHGDGAAPPEELSTTPVYVGVARKP